jgi:hypothetical protein
MKENLDKKILNTEKDNLCLLVGGAKQAEQITIRKTESVQ